MEAKEIKMVLEEDSLKILKEVDAIHRNTLINIGLKLVQKTELYKTLTGSPAEEIQKVASLTSLETIETETETAVEETKPAVGEYSWDDL